MTIDVSRDELAQLAGRFAALWRSLASFGADPGGHGYLRYAWSEADLRCREWFIEEALDRGLHPETDPNGNIWAWWGDPAQSGAVVTGSHFDSVPHGGAYDGPLGIVSALLAVDLMRERGVRPTRPVGIVVFTEEEGSRFGLACLGSRLLTGALPGEQAHRLIDRDGISLATAMAAAGVDPTGVGPQPDRIANLHAFVELHIEQGRALATLDAPVGVASAIWPHGRWRLDLAGEGNHAGTTAMADRRDPMLTLAYTILAANKQARSTGALATIGRVRVEPNATNAIATRISAWLDLRAPDQSTVDETLATIHASVRDRAARDGVTALLVAESVTGQTIFDPSLRDRIAARLGGNTEASAPVLATGAGHDAGVLATAGVPTAMLFVRNPTGVSHAPAESATDLDAAAGIAALATVLTDLAQS